MIFGAPDICLHFAFSEPRTRSPQVRSGFSTPPAPHALAPGAMGLQGAALGYMRTLGREQYSGPRSGPKRFLGSALFCERSEQKLNILDSRRRTAGFVGESVFIFQAPDAPDATSSSGFRRPGRKSFMLRSRTVNFKQTIRKFRTVLVSETE